MRGRKLGTLFLTGIFFTTLFLGCGNKEEEANERKSNKELIVAVAEEPEAGFDSVTGGHGSMTKLFFSTLFKRNKDLSIEKDLAKDYKVSEDKLKWTISIREDVKFTDGSKLTAEDVEFTFETAKKSGGEVDLTILESVKALDNKTVEFTLNKPQSIFIEKMANVGIVPKHAYNSEFGIKPIGSGPFKFVQWDKGQQVIATVNNEYYGEKPKIEKLTMVFLSEEAALSAIKAGKVDLAKISASNANLKVDGKKIVTLDSIETYGVEYPMVKSGENNEDGNPIGNDVTSDRVIREALTMAVNRKEILDGVLEGYGAISTTGLEKMPWLNSETSGLKDGDAEGAKNLLGNSGWIDRNDDGIREKNGVKAEFKLVYTEGMYRQELALAYQKVAKDIGIKVDIESKTWDTIVPEINSCAVLYGWGSGEPSELYSLYSSKVEKTNLPWNNSGYYSNPKVDEYIEKALLSQDEEEALEFWKKSQWDSNTGFSWKGDCAYTWLVNAGHIYISDEDLDIGEPGVQPHGGRIFDNVTEWQWNN